MIARRPTSVLAIGVLAVAFPMSAIGHIATEQQPTNDETARGISLQQQGKTEEAVASLRAAVKRNKNDLRAWHHLGLALGQKGDSKEARKAHEKAAKLGDALLTSHLASATGPDYIRFLVAINSPLNKAAASARKYIELSPKLSKSKAAEWSERADYLGEFAELSNPNGPGERLGQVFTSKAVTTKARILRKPEPRYTEQARAAQTTGTVVLRAILSADGKVRAIVPVKSLSNGLTANCIRVARLIDFIPATIDGRPVSMFIQLEYSFNLY